MGQYLDIPIRDKNSETGKSTLMYWGLCSMQGWRFRQEDDHIVEEITQADKQKAMFFAVFDGHGGQQVAELAKLKLVKMFTNQKAFQKGDFQTALE